MLLYSNELHMENLEFDILTEMEISDRLILREFNFPNDLPYLLGSLRGSADMEETCHLGP